MVKELSKASGLHQLPLPFHLNETYTFQNFYPVSNEVVVACLKQLIQQPHLTHSIYLWGHRFVGCTHLLKSCCKMAQQAGFKAIYLSLADAVNQKSFSYLSHLTEAEIVCLDDVEAVGLYPEWEEALFGLYNRLSAKGIPLVFGAHHVPRQLPLSLLDLVSRLNSGLLFQVHELNDEQKIAALILRAELRGLVLPRPVAQFLLLRLPRSPRSLLDALNQLDLFALAKKRKLTLPFVKEVLKL